MMQTYFEIAPNMNQDFYIQLLCKQILIFNSSSNIPEASRICFAINHLHYKEVIKLTYNFSLFQPFFNMSSILDALFNYIVKVMKLLYNISKPNNRFAIYYLHYKDKLVGNLTQAFDYIINCSYFLYGLSNFSTTFFFAHNSNAYTTKPGLVTKKREPPRTFLHFFSRLFSLLSLFLSLTPSKICLAISEYLAVSKCMIISEWQICFLVLANFFLLADCLSIKLTCEIIVKETKIMIKNYGNFTLI